MLPSFETFLKSKPLSKAQNREAIIAILPLWIDRLILDIHTLAKRKIISPITADTCETALSNWRDSPKRNLPLNVDLKFIATLYAKMVNFLSSNIWLNPHLLSIPGGYPFGENISGVEMAVRIVEISHGDAFTYHHKSNAHSLIGMDNQASSPTLKEVKTTLGKITWLEKRLNQMGKTVQDILPKDPHAEHIWFARNAQAVLNFLLNNKNIRHLPKLNDALPQTQLAQGYRLEVITSSSCCAQCRYLFSALRLELQENGIFIPIILYADTAYNSTRNYVEHHGSIYIINSEGQFINAELQCITPKTQKQRILPLEKLKLEKLSTKEQQDYACLARIGGLVIFELIKGGLRYQNQNDINPFTYIAPDALIIYIAENLAAKPEASPSLVELANYLDSALAKIDRRILVYWRMCFNEQLHWLLISHLYPKFYEEARKNAHATDTNFSVDLYGDEESEHMQFYLQFSRLWQEFKNLSTVYLKMFDFFMEESQMRMPLGCMVGPLSSLMIQDDPEFPEQVKRMLLRGRVINAPAKHKLPLADPILTEPTRVASSDVSLKMAQAEASDSFSGTTSLIEAVGFVANSRMAQNGAPLLESKHSAAKDSMSAQFKKRV